MRMGIHSGSCVGGVVGSKVYGAERHEFWSRFDHGKCQYQYNNNNSFWKMKINYKINIISTNIK